MSTTRHRLVLLGAGVVVVALSASSGAVAGGLIDSHDIANGSIRSVDIQDGTIHSKDVTDRTIRARDLRQSLMALIKQAGPQGPKGDKGDPGATGPQGPAGPTANVDALTDRIDQLEAKVEVMGACPVDFWDDQMWEVTWGYDFAHRNGGATLFDIDSYGGLASVNGDTSKPAELRGYAADWRWLYPTAPVVHKVWTYEFNDTTVITATVDPDAHGCPVIVWSGIPTP